MLSTTYELVIEDYLLSQSRSMLVRHQYWLRAARKFRAPDVLAIDPTKCAFYLVEVTASQHPSQLLEKLQDYEDGRLRILAGLKHAFQINVDKHWTVQPWLFVWKELKQPLAGEIAKFDPMITPLEAVFAPTPRGIDTVSPTWGQRPNEVALLTPEEIERYPARSDLDTQSG